jgi:hypothetical protein
VTEGNGSLSFVFSEEEGGCDASAPVVEGLAGGGGGDDGGGEYR